MFIGNDARTMMLMGINKVADYVSLTMGPGGKIVNIKRGNTNHLTKDGVTVARDFVVPDQHEQMGVDFIYEAAKRTVTEAGDGTTTTTVMCREMMLQGHQRLALKKLNTNRIAKEMVRFSELAIKYITAQSVEVALGDEHSEKLLVDVGTISANGDKGMAEMCLQAIKEVGPEPSNINCSVAEFDEKDSYTVRSGLHIPSRVGGEILGPFNTRKLRALQDGGKVAVVIVTSLDQEIGLTGGLNAVLNAISKDGNGILVVAKEPASNLRGMLVNRSEKNQTAFISPSLHGNKYIQLCEDIITLTGAKELPTIDEGVTPPIYLGYAQAVDINKDGMTLNEPMCEGTDQHLRLVEQVKEMISTETQAHSIEMLKDRLARLTNGVVNIRVTGSADANVYERLDRYDDCIRAMITALKTGVVRGGGAAYLSAAYQLLAEEVDPLDQEMKIARDLVESALVTPFNTITQNALNYIPKIKGRTLVNETNLTIDVWSGDFIDAFEHGILDPLGVQISAIRSSVRATAVFLNTGGIYQGRAAF